MPLQTPLQTSPLTRLQISPLTPNAVTLCPSLRLSLDFLIADGLFVSKMETEEMKKVCEGLLEIRSLSARLQGIKGLVLKKEEMEDTSARLAEIMEKSARIDEMKERHARLLLVKEMVAKTLELKGMMKDIFNSRMVENHANSSSTIEEVDGKDCNLSHAAVSREFEPDLEVSVPNLGVLASDMGVLDSDLGVCGPNLNVFVLELFDLAREKVQVWCIVGLLIIVRDWGSMVPAMSVLGELHPLVFTSFFVFDGGGLFLIMLCLP